MRPTPTPLTLREPASTHARELFAWVEEKTEGLIPTTRATRYLPAKHFEDIYRNRLAWLPKNSDTHRDMANAVDDLARCVAPLGVITLALAGTRTCLFVDSDNRILTGFRGA